MSNNIFITGRMNTGKTVIIKKILAEINLSYGGFMVGREQGEIGWSSFYLLPVNIFLKDNQEKIKKIKEKSTFIWKDVKRNRKLEPDVFDNYGVKLLNNAVNKDLIVMDELGRFELKSYKFQKKVLELIKSDKLVLGVIKLEKNIFLDKIRDLLEKEPFFVTKNNREQIYNYVLDELNKWRTENDQSYLTRSR